MYKMAPTLLDGIFSHKETFKMDRSPSIGSSGHKYQMIDIELGITIDLYGCIALHRNDISLFIESAIID